MQNKEVKILFRFYSDLLEKNMVETVWAELVDENKGHYRIDNIPFYVPGIAPDDIIKAEFDENENFLIFKESIEYSGNSVIRVIKFDDTLDINILRNRFKELACTSERMDNKYFVIEIPKSVDYKSIKKELQKMEDSGILAYAEAVLSNEHK